MIYEYKILNVHSIFSSLYNLMESDAGYYICNAENSVGRNRDYVFVTVEREEGDNRGGEQDRREDEQRQEAETPATPSNKPFVFIKTQSNGKLINTGEEFQLTCIANGKAS